MNADEFEFDFSDLSPKDFKFKYQNKSYVLKEASLDAAVAYRNVAFKSVKFVKGKAGGIDGLADGEPLVLSKCIFEVTATGEKPVPESFIRKLPNSMTKQLFEKLKVMSNLTDDDDTIEKIDKKITLLNQKKERIQTKSTIKNSDSSTMDASSSVSN